MVRLKRWNLGETNGCQCLVWFHNNSTLYKWHTGMALTLCCLVECEQTKVAWRGAIMQKCEKGSWRASWRHWQGQMWRKQQRWGKRQLIFSDWSTSRLSAWDWSATDVSRPANEDALFADSRRRKKEGTFVLLLTRPPFHCHPLW